MQQRPSGRRAALSVFAVAIFGLVVPCAGAPPTPVSPGDAEAGARVRGRCPTFSWTGVGGVRGYELALYRVEETENAEVVGEAEPKLLDRVRLPAGSTGWTPSLDRCLEWGGRYAWSVRALAGGGRGEWSEASLFEVSGVPSASELDAAVETLERYLGADERAKSKAEDRRAKGARPRTTEGEQRAPRAGLAPADRPAEPSLPRPAGIDASAASKIAPVVGSVSLRVDSDIALGAEGNFFKHGDILLWDDGAGNLALGERALGSAGGDASNNTAFGEEALKSTFGGSNPSDGSHNAAVGFRALEKNAVGFDNTAVGSEALGNSVTAIRNTAVGRAALSESTGSFNTAVGALALLHNGETRDNTAVGSEALRETTTGPDNTAVGSLTLRGNTTGAANTAVGRAALLDNTTGGGNVAIGKAALGRNTTGDGNIAIGAEAGLELGDVDNTFSNLSHNIYIGNGGREDEQATIRIGNDTDHDRTFIAGISGASVTGAIVSVAPDGQLGIATSSRRFKEEIEPLDGVAERLLELEPVTFRYRSERVAGGGDPEVGLIAEDVAELFPELVTRNPEGEPFSVRYDLLSVLLLEELQRQHEALERQHALDGAYRRQLAALRERLRALEQSEASADGEPPWWRRLFGAGGASP